MSSEPSAAFVRDDASAKQWVKALADMSTRGEFLSGECNNKHDRLFCTDCAIKLCARCQGADSEHEHSGHTLLQVRGSLQPHTKHNKNAFLENARDTLLIHLLAGMCSLLTFGLTFVVGVCR